ncbi:DUF6094 domain-containing protein [Prevotella sp.]|uniref:DUF6094 domain-containing protein n=1 Tax=Prevotella sp. TaxID=59823 RepID=UPI003F815B52
MNSRNRLVLLTESSFFLVSQEFMHSHILLQVNPPFVAFLHSSVTRSPSKRMSLIFIAICIYAKLIIFSKACYMETTQICRIRQNEKRARLLSACQRHAKLENFYSF